jgi:hypothetical protein
MVAAYKPSDQAADPDDILGGTDDFPRGTPAEEPPLPPYPGDGEAAPAEPLEPVALHPPRRAPRALEPAPMIDRLPPQNLDSEQAVLGSILIDRDAIIEVADFLHPEDFYRQANGRIYAAMLELQGHRRPIDVVTVADLLESAGDLESIGGAGYLSALGNDTPTAVHVAQYGRIVERKAVLRRLIGAAGRIAAIGYEDGSDIQESIERARAEFEAAAATSTAPSSSDVMARTGARSLADVSPAPAPAPLLGKLDPEGPTVLFGEGGAGKGVLAASWIVGLVRESHRVLLVDYEGHPGEWARRVESLGGADAREAVMYVTPAGPSWNGRRGPLWAQADDLRELATEHGADYVVVDSAVPACGATDPLKPEAAGQYAAGLERIGRPALTIAHVTKAGDGRMPYGSAYWHNLARVTWSLARDGDALVLQNRKANAYPWLGRFAVAFTWYEGILGEVSERPYSLALADRIAELLAEGPLGVRDLAGALSAGGDAVTEATLRSALNRARDRFEHDGEQWSLRNV